jgi:TetR/AcrR family transcriptional repressor of nem operon
MAIEQAVTKGENTRARILESAEKLVLNKGYTGTSVDNILAETGLTKGAFFYHFRSKAALAQALIETFWQRDRALFEDISRQAAELADDPLQEVLLWFKLLEDAIMNMENPPTSCLFTSYLYERGQFDTKVLQYIEAAFEEWSAILEPHFQRLLEWREPRFPMTAKDLAELAIALVEGGFVVGQAYDEPRPDAVLRQSARFRQYLQLLFAA